jgi:hypothetical protein
MPTASAQPGECTIIDLNITVGGGDAGAGHRSVALIFRNTATATCQLRGYPGVAALDGQGTQVEQAQRSPAGYLGGLKGTTVPTVDVAPGQTASALVEALASGPGGASCTGYRGLLVTPPDETHSVRLALTWDGCSNLQIHPVVPGDTGQQA